MRAAFRVHDLSYRYGRADRLALDGVDLSADGGRVVGFLGPNGCGKTTLIRILATSLRPTQGTVRLFPDEAEQSIDRRRRRVATCFDRVSFMEALSGRENALRLTGLRGVGPTESAHRVDRWLAAFGLTDRAGDSAATYSLGMRRKLALTEVLAAEADLLLLDEPLGGLDAEGRAALLASLRAERERGASTVVAVHDPEFAAAACDTVVLIDEGRVLTSGSPAALIEALSLETTFDVTLVAVPAGLAVPDGGRLALPDGVRLLGTTPEGIRVASERGAVALPDTAGAIVAAGGEIRAIRVREPDLDDVFVSLTGRALDTSRSAAA